ncbi:MAG: tRNA (N6-threonylcarbamoyladenosine(37)-N6)-methyltransferase TrmO [Chloroflexota bacterium]|nr:tRNA (N6-threonylcarbamoyladenosine(37)-N6)-methyltransferase TrmO [Chloroflexota bacterium]
MSVVLRPIGHVVSPVAEPSQQEWESVVSEVVVDDAYAEALDGIEEFSHIIVIFYFHRSEPPTALRIHPERRQELPLVGIFATRSPMRPNPIGVTTVRLLERRGNVLRVQGLDAIDGTPVLDIKPHIPIADACEGARVPRWIDVLSGKESRHD